MSYLIDTAKDIQAQAKEHDSVLVAFSGGKDSLVVLDLCRRAFKRIVCFHLNLVPDLDIIRERVDDYLAPLGIECLHYPDPVAMSSLRDGLFCDELRAAADLSSLTSADLYRQASADTGIELVADGKKEADYRQRAFHLRGGRLFGWHPIQKWKKKDVLDYCKKHNITVPESHVEAGGIDLTSKSLCWLHDKHPDDFKKLLKWFPYAEAVIKRRDWFPPPASDKARGVQSRKRAAE